MDSALKTFDGLTRGLETVGARLGRAWVIIGAKAGSLSRLDRPFDDGAADRTV